ncbi:hypothetical protein [Synechococcus sp. 1G10]|uniref:hypothetical protein n=1 Tax=Synechococcus sp. 1G10 TaxID=2025605 RepID=UPI000B986C8E|nr:hypothetical protein [Synechococcus sp. 1G10]
MVSLPLEAEQTPPRDQGTGFIDYRLDHIQPGVGMPSTPPQTATIRQRTWLSQRRPDDFGLLRSPTAGNETPDPRWWLQEGSLRCSSVEPCPVDRPSTATQIVVACLGAGVVTSFAVAQGQNPLTALGITLFSAVAAVMVGQVL